MLDITLPMWLKTESPVYIRFYVFDIISNFKTEHIDYVDHYYNLIYLPKIHIKLRKLEFVELVEQWKFLDQNKVIIQM